MGEFGINFPSSNKWQSEICDWSVQFSGILHKLKIRNLGKNKRDLWRHNTCDKCIYFFQPTASTEGCGLKQNYLSCHLETKSFVLKNIYLCNFFCHLFTYSTLIHNWYQLIDIDKVCEVTPLLWYWYFFIDRKSLYKIIKPPYSSAVKHTVSVQTTYQDVCEVTPWCNNDPFYRQGKTI